MTDTNDLLSKEEIDVLLQQLIDETAPNRPSDEEANAVVKWASDVRIGTFMLEMVFIGDATVRIVDGHPSFRLTPKGMAGAENLMAKSADARAFHDQLVAESGGKLLAKGPDGQQ